MLQQYVTVPKIYAMKRDRLLFDFSNSNMTYEQVYEIIKHHSPLFIKPYAKGKGNGVFRLDYKNGCPCIDEKQVSYDDMIAFLKKQEDWMICQAMSQHSYSSQIYDKTVNTIRLITLRDPKTDEFKIFTRFTLIQARRLRAFAFRTGIILKRVCSDLQRSSLICISWRGIFSSHLTDFALSRQTPLRELI